MIISDAIGQSGVDVHDHLDRSADVPVVHSAACQGDVSLLKVTITPARSPLPASGVAVVRGEAGRNTHSLHPSGPCFWEPAEGGRDELLLGTLTVPAGSTAVLGHPEHGFLEIAPGTWRVGRQREWAGQWRLVAD